MSRPPSPRRFALWAALLVLPLVLASAAYPWLSRRLRAGGAVEEARGAARAAEQAAAATARRADGALGAPGRSGPSGGGSPGGGGGTSGAGGTDGAPAPRPPEGPTPAQIEAAREADLAVARAQQGWQRVETIAPREARRDAQGELTAPFHGFGLSVETTPPGAAVRVAGKDAGEAPLVTSVDCRPGEEVEVRLTLRGHRPEARKVRCRADTLLTVEVALRR